MFRKPLIAAFLAVGIASTASVTAQAADHDLAVQCAAVIKVTTQTVPPDHPSAGQIKDLIERWTIFAAAESYPKPANVDAAILAKADEIQTRIMSLQDRAKSQAYIAEIGSQCEAPPYEAVHPNDCRIVAEAVKATAEARIDLENYIGWNTTEKRSDAEIKASDKKRADTILAQRRIIRDAEAVSAHYAKATSGGPNRYAYSTPEMRLEKLETCQQQMH